MYTRLFEYGIWQSYLKTNLREYCDNIRKQDLGRNQSNVGGYHSNLLNLNEPILNPLIFFIETETLKYSKQFNIKRNSFKLVSMWFNINGKGNYNAFHTHAGTIFSGVYYVNVPENSGDLEFLREDADLKISYWYKIDYASYTPLNSDKWTVSAKENVLYLFPSFYRHGVQPNCNENGLERYSISFSLI